MLYINKEKNIKWSVEPLKRSKLVNDTMFSLQSRLLADQLLVPPKNQINKNDIINLCADVLYFFCYSRKGTFLHTTRGKGSMNAKLR